MGKLPQAATGQNDTIDRAGFLPGPRVSRPLVEYHFVKLERINL
jgi:hypothetical protein